MAPPRRQTGSQSPTPGHGYRHDDSQQAGSMGQVDRQSAFSEGYARELRMHFACPYCQRWLSVPLRSTGTADLCPGCRNAVRIPELDERVHGLDEVARTVQRLRWISLQCPGCARPVQVPLSGISRRIGCPHCGIVLRLSLSAEAPATQQRQASSGPVTSLATSPTRQAEATERHAASPAPPVLWQKLVVAARSPAARLATLAAAGLLVCLLALYAGMHILRSPRFDSADLERTLRWATEQTAELAELASAGNELAYERARQELLNELGALASRSVRWQVPVQRVTAQQVVLKTRWACLELAFVPGDEQLRWDNCFGLRIGEQIEPGQAAQLSPDDLVTIEGTVRSASLLAGQRIWMELGLVRAAPGR